MGQKVRKEKSRWIKPREPFLLRREEIRERCHRGPETLTAAHRSGLEWRAHVLPGSSWLPQAFLLHSPYFTNSHHWCARDFCEHSGVRWNSNHHTVLPQRILWKTETLWWGHKLKEALPIADRTVPMTDNWVGNHSLICISTTTYC